MGEVVFKSKYVVGSFLVNIYSGESRRLFSFWMNSVVLRIIVEPPLLAGRMMMLELLFRLLRLLLADRVILGGCFRKKIRLFPEDAHLMT